MDGLSGASNAIWGIATVAEFILLATMLHRGGIRKYPYFFSYIAATVVQSLILFFIYSAWGYKSFVAWFFAWLSQFVLLTGRALSVAETCHRQFEEFRGIWEFIRRVLLVCAAIVVVYAVFIARHHWPMIMPNIQRGLDLGITTTLVGLFLFSRYYDVQVSPVLRSMALGFLLFSAFAVLNSTILERVMQSYASSWSLLQMVFFVASVVIWVGAQWQPHMARERATILASSDVYQTFAPEVNVKLRALNDHLSRFWKVEAGQQ